jgi:hypothetical protein
LEVNHMVTIALDGLDSVERAKAVAVLRDALTRPDFLVALQRPDGLSARATTIDPHAIGRYVIVDLTAPITDADIIRQYQHRPVSAASVAGDLSVSLSRVYAVLRAAGVMRKPGGPRKHPRGRPRGSVPPDSDGSITRHYGPSRGMYDHAYTSDVRQAFDDDWWRTIVWSRDSQESDAWVTCDLCGMSWLSYFPSGGLVTCYPCWYATATPEELEAQRQRLRERARTQERIRKSNGLSRGEFLPIHEQYPPMGAADPGQSRRSATRQALVTQTARAFGLRRDLVMSATSASCRSAMAAADRRLLLRTDGAPLCSAPQIQSYQAHTDI